MNENEKETIILSDDTMRLIMKKLNVFVRQNFFFFKDRKIAKSKLTVDPFKDRPLDPTNFRTRRAMIVLNYDGDRTYSFYEGAEFIFSEDEVLADGKLFAKTTVTPEEKKAILAKLPKKEKPRPMTEEEFEHFMEKYDGLCNM